MKSRTVADKVRYQRMNTEEMRESYLLELFTPGELDFVYTDVDRAIVGSAVPMGKALELSTAKELASDYFAERREIGVVNIGRPGSVTVDGKVYAMGNLDGLYIGRGSKTIAFNSDDAKNPARFYILSYPAHTAYPTTHIQLKDAVHTKLGSMEESNARTIHKYILPGKVQSCQLVMGVTQLETGSVWNTMSAHTHERRTEVYCYFDIAANDVVFHFMGMPDETRHIVIRDGQAVISPSWSIHAGCGTRKYSFIWGMGGENQAFDDMDGVAMDVIQ